MAVYSPIDPNEFDRFLKVLSQSAEFRRAEDDLGLAMYQLRRECSIVHAMSEEERDFPKLAFENDRLRRIAVVAGVTTVEVAYLVNRQRDGVGSERWSDAMLEGWRVTTYCPETHAEMQKGRCPWCGKELFGYRTRW